MNKTTDDYNTWVYHALNDAKIVKASEARKLYRQGWRDTPDPKILFKGIRGKWYKFIIQKRALTKWAKSNPNVSIPLIVTTTVGIAAIIVTLFVHFHT